MPKYIKEKPQSFFVLDPNGKEIPCGEVGDFVIREMQISDISKCFKTPTVKKCVKLLKRLYSWNDKHARAKVEADFRKRIRSHPEEEFALNYIIERNGEFIGYAEVENFGIEDDKEKSFVRVGQEGGSKTQVKVEFGDEPTYAGVELFLLEPENGELVREVCKAFGNLCTKYGFYDHLELMQASRDEKKVGKKVIEVIKISLYGALYDWEIAKATQEVANTMQEAS